MDSAESLAQLLNYGVLGILTVLLLGFARHTILRLIEDRDKAEARVELLTDKVFNEVAPMLSRATAVIEDRPDRDAEVLEVLRDVRRLLEGRQ